MTKFQYESTKKENVPCAICGIVSEHVVSRHAGDGTGARTVMCKKCGLIYINPRMTRGEYDSYYKYHYREHRKSIKGKEPGGILEGNWISAIKFGSVIGRELSQYFIPGLVIDVGSSTGGVLEGLKQVRSDLDILGVEPSLEESEFARQKGIPTMTGLFEDVSKEISKKPSTIVCVQSLNHLLDPLQFLKWSHDTLESGGHVILAVKNFLFQARRAGSVVGGIQIDHPYMFTQDSLRRLVEAAGFEVVFADDDEKKSAKEKTVRKKDGWSTHHMRIVGRKGGDKESRHDSFSRVSYFVKLVQFSPIMVYITYLIKYSRRFDFIRKRLNIFIR